MKEIVDSRDNKKDSSKDTHPESDKIEKTDQAISSSCDDGSVHSGAGSRPGNGIGGS